MVELKKVRTITAKTYLKAIYENYKVQSVQSAKTKKMKCYRQLKNFILQNNTNKMRYNLNLGESYLLQEFLILDKIQINKKNEIVKEQKYSFFYVQKIRSKLQQQAIRKSSLLIFLITSINDY